MRVGIDTARGSIEMYYPANALVGREGDAKSGTRALKHVTVRMGLCGENGNGDHTR